MAMNTATVYVIGNIWQPGIGLCAQSQVMRGEEMDRVIFQNRVERDDVMEWAYVEFGDFKEITDVSLVFHNRPGTQDLDWQDEESEVIYNDCMFPSEDEGDD